MPPTAVPEFKINLEGHFLWLTTLIQSYYNGAMNGSVTISEMAITVPIELEAACGN
jgi:hypothetical protein